MLISPEGRKVKGQATRLEHPNPQFARDSITMLHGLWGFHIDQKKDNHEDYPDSIMVPFAVETELSLVGKRITKDDVLHYKKEFTYPVKPNRRVFLHFEAVDQVCDIYLNGLHLGHHEGGYLPFSFEAKIIQENNVLLIDVTDDVDSPIFPRGKQMKKPGGIWYTPTSGIYGVVYLEEVPKTFIKSVRILPMFAEKRIRFEFEGTEETVVATITHEGSEIASGKSEGGVLEIDLSASFHPWSPDDPYLYDVLFVSGEDHVRSYFAMRSFETVNHNGFQVFGLNGKPLFLSGVLDQGYWPESGLTAPSDQAMVDDIMLLKNMGFNMVRKHIKIEPLRWYYHCDRLGMLVMQDIVSGGSAYNPFLIVVAPFLNLKFDDTKKPSRFGRGDPLSRSQFEEDLKGTVSHLFNIPSIFGWTLFNEGWGQFEAKRLTGVLRGCDGTRLIDSTSGWYDQGVGDFDSHHIYFRKAKLKPSKGRILALSEFGGYSLRLPGHVFSKRNFGYKLEKDQEALNKDLSRLYREEIVPLKENAGLSLTVFTQLSDVEEETNGLITYDRQVEKADAATMRSLNEELKFE